MNDDVPAAQRRVRWDPTINLGHVLTFVGFISTGALAYFDLRERITIQEVRQQQTAADFNAEKQTTRELLREVRDEVREVRRGMENLNRKP